MIGARSRGGVGRPLRGSTKRLSRIRPRRWDRSGVDEPARWRSRRWVRLVAWLTAAIVVAFFLWLGWVAYLYVVRGGPSGATFDPDHRCSSLSFSCGVLTNLVASGALVAFAFTFLLWRLFGLQRRYRAKAQYESRELVPTAGAIIDQVVGRDELCKAVMADLHDRRRRPHVIVGGVGSGKTAVLVRLTELLADRQAIPVPVKLRDAASDLDFEALARDRFLSEVNPDLFSSAEGETIWRRLRKDGKIIVLADGLEEALIGTGAEPERDNIIRAAIRRAHQQHLPLVIASRPHDPLRATEAAILNLEPLSYEAALAYIGGEGKTEDDRRLAWIVETADVVEAPLYLQITRELHDKGLLEPTSAGQQGVVDTRGVDRSRLRLSLLETWERALIYGHLREEIPLNRAERQAAVEHMSALACAGLSRDLLEIDLDIDPGPLISAEVQRQLARIDEQAGQLHGVLNVDVRLAAAWAAQLDLVELRGRTVRFPHSLMQAYLGSRLLDTALRDPAFCQEALQYPRPGREFLIAQVLRSRAVNRPPGRERGDGQAAADDAATADRAATAGRDGGTAGDRVAVADAVGMSDGPAAPDRVTDAGSAAVPRRGGRKSRRPAAPETLGQPDEPGARPDEPALQSASEHIGPLRQAASQRDDNKVLDMWAAVLEIDSVAAEPEHLVIADEIMQRWTRIHAQDRRTLEEGKVSLVHRFGDAARMISDRGLRGDRLTARPGYPQLYSIGCADPSYPVQLAAAQEIGSGGEAAYTELRGVLTAPCLLCDAERAERAGGPADGATAAAGRPQQQYGSAESSRAAIISAWLAPMLVGSVGRQTSAAADRLIAEHAQADLAQWLRHVGHDGRQQGERELPIALEIALAQGFKYAANRRPMQPDAFREARMYLAEQALEMLKSARYWFSQLTLIHALCLLNLSDGQKQPAEKFGAKPEAIVAHWLDVAGQERGDRSRPAAAQPEQHQFVREAALLCVLALRTGRPQRYLWIDESGVVGQVGSRNLSKEVQRRHQLWIPPSAGWTALNGRAQQLVADVLLLLNLADRGEQPTERDRRLRRSNRPDLPPCITHYREALEPGRTVGTAVSSVPGVSCVDGCVFELCPYPPQGVQPRVEMSEAFCRRQQTLLNRSLRHPLNGRAPWQLMKEAQLDRFWTEMADRARGPRPRSAQPRRRIIP
jgi:hypothetical protein